MKNGSSHVRISDMTVLNVPSLLNSGAKPQSFIRLGIKSFESIEKPNQMKFISA